MDDAFNHLPRLFCCWCVAICLALCAARPAQAQTVSAEANPLREEDRPAIAPEPKPVGNQGLPELKQPAAAPQLAGALHAAQTQSEPKAKPSAKQVTKAEIKQQLELVKVAENLSDDDLATAEQRLQTAMEWLAAAEEDAARAVEYERQVLALPQRKRDLTEQLDTPPTTRPPQSRSDASSKQIEPLVQELAQQYEAVAARQTRNQQRQEALAKSRREYPQIRETVSQQLDALETLLEQDRPVEVGGALSVSGRLERLAHRDALHARLQALKAEAEFAEAYTEIAPLQSDVDQREAARLEAQLEQLRQLLAQRRQQESRRQVEEALQQAREAHPALKGLATHNHELAEKRAKYAELARRLTSELTRLSSRFEEQEESFNRIQERVDEIGLTESIGLLLRAQREQLMDVRSIVARAKEIQKEYPHVQLALLDTDEKRQAMFDLGEMTDELLGSIDARLFDRFTAHDAREMILDLLQKKRDLLGGLRHDLDEYSTQLFAFNALSQRVATATREHRAYIDEHVLWIRSAAPVGAGDLQLARGGIARLVDAAAWTRVIGDVGNSIRGHAMVSFAAFLVLVMGLTMCDRLKDRVAAVGKTKEVKVGYRFFPSMEVLAATCVTAAFAPGFCYFAGWFLVHGSSPSDLSHALGEGLRWTGLMWLALSFLGQLTRPNGLGESHFGWHAKNLAVLRGNLSWLVLVGLPMVFVVVVIEVFQEGSLQNSLGRLSFMAGMVVMAIFMHRLLSPYRATSGIWANREIWTFRFRYVLHAFGVAIPLGLAVLTAIGFVYSAHQLAYRAQLSLWLVIGIVTAHALVTRYFTIIRRRAAIRHMQRRRSEQAENDSADDVPIDDNLDFAAIGDQLKRLLRGAAVVSLLMGSSLVWADMIPALMMLDRVELWETTVQQAQQADGTLRSVSMPITLGDVILCALSIVATIVAARNLPGLLNITIFERLPIDYGTRYALTTVTRYVISLVGFVVAFQLVGITWGRVQWLVAAMTVGLGFGLQEIFANFVSGLIILTERPVRVGDMVTVAGVTGKVTRVQIRATTITDYDRRELVVPNKRFITEDVINWTLSDPITRVVLPVGIAYACDPRLARQRLLEVAANHTLVLKEPEPTAIFMGFGESTLDLELRVFIVGRDNLFQVRDELNLAINESFRESQLEIAYPQRDLHIRSVDAQVVGVSLPAVERKAA